LLWDGVGSKIYLKFYKSAEKKSPILFTTELVNDLNMPTTFTIGESRLEYGDNIFRAYYHVHGVSSWQTGHEGDSLKTITADGVDITEWDWGCSHSMSNLLKYNPDL